MKDAGLRFLALIDAVNRLKSIRLVFLLADHCESYGIFRYSKIHINDLSVDRSIEIWQKNSRIQPTVHIVSAKLPDNKFSCFPVERAGQINRPTYTVEREARVAVMHFYVYSKRGG